ncbi:MAG: thioredoxin domain-containing protein [Planctomycetota bacterium]|jgi:uncharacterized protein YyaL (SSP411 family)
MEYLRQNRVIFFSICLITGVVYFSSFRADDTPAETAGALHNKNSGEQKMFTNRLINETSPYLLQHAKNPVDWYPWGDEAFEKAKKEDKPVFLSIGYSTCHWCHVMEHESFESEEVAAIMNKHLVNIKVDREERPDLDHIYMTAVQMLTGSGGWPMSVFLTPDRKPFWGGTYFPPESKWGRPGFKEILTSISEAFKNDRKKIEEQAGHLSSAISNRGSIAKQFKNISNGKESLTTVPISKLTEELKKTFDAKEGSFGPAPKFPPKSELSVLMRDFSRTRKHATMQMITLTLDKMAKGGIYDHLAGGFHRYSTDEKWLLPHFEKMLYDNALLSRVYIDAYLLTGKDLYADTAKDIFAYILREMTSLDGGFYSATDADSEEEEGKFFIWKADEIKSILGDDDYEIFSYYYNIKGGGNFSSPEHYHDGFNIIHVNKSIEETTRKFSISKGDLVVALQFMRGKLLAVRNKRIAPGLDDKILTAWNGLMIGSMAKGYQVFRDKQYLAAAEKAADFILNNMRKDRHLLRTYRQGRAKLPGYLNDYAYFVSGLIDLYEASFDVRWLKAARELSDIMITEFWDKDELGFFFTAERHSDLITRVKQNSDSAIPAGNSIAVMNLLRLAKLLDHEVYYKYAESALKTQRVVMEAYPHVNSSILEALDFFVNGPKEIAVAGKKDSVETEEMIAEINNQYLPNRVIAFIDPESSGAEEIEQYLPLLKDKVLVNGKTTVFICKDFTCGLPLTDSEKFAETLAEE